MWYCPCGTERKTELQAHFSYFFQSAFLHISLMLQTTTNYYHFILCVNSLWNKILKVPFIDHQDNSCTSPSEKHSFYMVRVLYTALWFLFTRIFSVSWISTLWNIKYFEMTTKTLLETRAEGLLKSVLSTLFYSYRYFNHQQMPTVKLILKRL